jgi:D-3-phosphoglycerate dehydrogenase
VRANAEYLLGALLMLYRRGLGSALLGRSQGLKLGREIHGSTIGLLGLAPTAHPLAMMLSAMGARLVGYDPAIHHTAPIWQRLNIQPVSLFELIGTSDAVSVQMLYATRFKGFINDKVLSPCKPGQLWVGTSRSDLFDPTALAQALCDGRIDAAMLDGAEEGFAGPSSPLYSLANLAITPRLGSHTRESRSRASWYVAHRIHEHLTAPPEALPQNSSPMPLAETTGSGYGEDAAFIIR